MRPGRVATALALDALFGEPPEALHPTVWMGHAISLYERRALRWRDPGPRLAAGLVLAAALPALVFLASRAVLRAVPGALRAPVEAALISTTLSMRGLAEAAEAVDDALSDGNLPLARANLSRFVGRDTARLTEPEVCRAVVESVAENTGDGVVGPMLYALAAGAPGALAYKAVNTLDSMLGHPDPPYTHLGRAPARLDDLANLLPSRATALAAAVASPHPAETLRVAARYGPLTRSPNAGWAEAAFAGALGIRLGGRNTYGGVTRVGPVLGEGREPGAEDIALAVRLMRRCCTLFVGLALLAGTVRRA